MSDEGKQKLQEKAIVTQEKWHCKYYFLLSIV